jgi:Arc/MetJ family transcription regulator
MRTNIDINDKLMAAALKATGLKTKKDVVAEGLRRMVQIHNQRKILKYFGKFQWEGDLEAMRTDKPRQPSAKPAKKQPTAKTTAKPKRRAA